MRRGGRERSSKWNEPKRTKRKWGGGEIGAKGEKSNSCGGSFLVCCRSVFEITSLLFFFVLNVFFIFFLLSWQWLLMFATFSFGFLSCFFCMLLLRWRYSLMRLLLIFFTFLLMLFSLTFRFSFRKKNVAFSRLKCVWLFVGGKEGLEKRKVAQISQISECER